MAERVIVSVGKNSIGQFQMSIGNGRHGYRIAGGKYDGAGVTFLTAELNERDAREIRSYLDAAFPSREGPAQ